MIEGRIGFSPSPLAPNLNTTKVLRILNLLAFKNNLSYILEYKFREEEREEDTASLLVLIEMVRDQRNLYRTSSSSSSRGRNGGDDQLMMEAMMMNNNIGGGMSSATTSSCSNKPAWLGGLMAETFFGACGAHENRRKNEKNVFCLLCCRSICPHCLPSHRSHPLLQVRRYVYHDVIRLGDLEKFIDCSYIQPYTINGAKVIFLNQRPQSRSCKGSSNFCFNCDRILQEPFHFCSLSCKVDHLEDQGEDLSTILYRIDESEFACSQLEGLRMDSLEVIDDEAQITSSSINLDDSFQYNGSSGSNDTVGNSGISCEPEIVKKKKKKGSGFLPGIVLSLGSRRKGAPQRAPLS